VSEKRDAERLFAGYAGRMFVGVSLAWAVLQIGRFLLPPLLPSIIESTNISVESAGVTLGVLQLTYAVTQYPSGRYSDAVGRSGFVLGGLVVVAVGFLLLSATTTFALLAVAAAVLGVGKGLYAIPSRALLSDLFERRRGRALGVYTAGTDVGGIVAAGTAAVVLSRGTWRTPFLPLALALVALAVVLWAWNREPVIRTRPSLGLRETFARLTTNRRQRETLVAYALLFFMVNGFINFLPTFLTEAKGVTPELASAGYALVFLVGVVVKPVAGTLSDQFGRETVSVAGLVLAAASLVALLAVGSLALVAGVVALLAVGYKTQFPLADAMLMDAAPAGNAGGDLGAARAFFLVAGSLGPVYVGAVAGRIGYDVAYAGLAACLVLSAGILLSGRLRSD
jgi:MFS family permease